MASVNKVPGIYAIGEKTGGQTKYLYVGRSNDVKRRLQEHKSQKQQDIDKKVAGKFKQHKEPELRIKYVHEKRQKSKEGEYIQCLTEKNGYHPVLNKRGGDGCPSCASVSRGQKKGKNGNRAKNENGGPKVQSSGKSSIKLSHNPKTVSSVKSPNRHKVHPGKPSSSGRKISTRSSQSSRPSSGPKVSSAGRSSVRSSGGNKVSSGRMAGRSSGRRR